MALILDTSVLIAAERRRYSVRQLLEQLPTQYRDTEIAVSVVTIAELTFGAYRAPIEMHKQRHLKFIEGIYADVPVYPFTAIMASMVGRIGALLTSLGTTIAFEDLVIGATALHHGYSVATQNTRHFERIPGLNVITL